MKFISYFSKFIFTFDEVNRYIVTLLFSIFCFSVVVNH